MNLDHYPLNATENYLEYSFKSIGPNGTITKIVRFSPENSNGITYFNLGFGDLNEETGQVDDLSTSNNKDRNKILSTIAAIVVHFTSHFPDVMVYAQGSTPARTRLYQIGITAHWDEISILMNVYGFRTGQWERFEKNVNYEAFFVMRK